MKVPCLEVVEEAVGMEHHWIPHGLYTLEGEEAWAWPVLEHAVAVSLMELMHGAYIHAQQHDRAVVVVGDDPSADDGDQAEEEEQQCAQCLFHAWAGRVDIYRGDKCTFLDHHYIFPSTATLLSDYG